MKNIAGQLELSRLPSLPQVLAKLLREFNSDSLHLRALAELVSQDSAISMRILAVANSAAYSRAKPNASISQAINVLGLRIVKMIAISSALQQFVSHLALSSRYDLNRHWRHSLLTAFIAKAVAREIGYPDPEEAYLAGLLHDIGQLALLVLFPEDYSSLLSVEEGSIDLLVMEANAFGYNHAEIGGALAEFWSLDHQLVDAIRYHHETVSAVKNATELVKVAYLANALSRMEMEPNHPALSVARVFFEMDVERTQQLSMEARGELIALSLPMGIQIENMATPEILQDNLSKMAVWSKFIAHQQLHEEMLTSNLLTLAKEVCNDAASEQLLLENLMQTAQVLFEPVKLLLFEWDARSGLVCGRPVGDSASMIARVRFPLQAGKSLLADSLLSRSVKSSFESLSSDVLSMMDEQIIRMAGGKGILCAPIVNAHFMFGVMVLAYNDGSSRRTAALVRAIPAFFRQAADRLEDIRRVPLVAGDGLSTASEVDRYREHARKVVHEAGNPLTILKNYLKMMELKLADNKVVASEISVLNEEIDRVANIIKKFANPPENSLPVGWVDLNQVINDVISICDRALFSGVSILVETRLDKGLPMIRSDVERLKQVFLNLFKNAAEAMSMGGSLTVSSAATVDQVRGRSVLVTVSDNGPGMPAYVLDRLFSPVETTKGSSNSGLGLSITATVVAELGGVISCRSSAGNGTAFDVLLPVDMQSTQRVISGGLKA